MNYLFHVGHAGAPIENTGLRRLLRPEWLPTAVVLLLILVPGSRLLYLSVQRPAPRRRALERGGHGSRLRASDRDAALRTLSEGARNDVASPPVHALSLTTEDMPQNPSDASDSVASGIAAEWRAPRRPPTPPRRPLCSAPCGSAAAGSLAARAPLAQSKGWRIAYADVDELYAAAGLSRLTALGYYFELSQFEPRNARARIYSSSSADPLTDPVRAYLRLPLPRPSSPRAHCSWPCSPEPAGIPRPCCPPRSHCSGSWHGSRPSASTTWATPWRDRAQRSPTPADA